MVRIVDYDQRRRLVLAATINRYIKEANPISSLDIAKDFDLSPATIRNIFADLEEAGYLTHPYTSGGRIPTGKGYRYYVDFLISQMELLEGEKYKILRQYQDQANQLEEILDKTSDLIAQVTHYAGIASFLDRQDKFSYRGISFVLNQPEFQDFRRVRFLINLIEDKQQLLNIINRDFSQKTRVYIGQELDYPEMESYSLVVSSFGSKKRPLGRLAVLGPMRMEYNHIIPALEYISNALSDVIEDF
ncbi:MAG: hypothetical protein V1674_00035 [Candidatus Omnitrophota bacterium]